MIETIKTGGVDCDPHCDLTFNIFTRRVLDNMPDPVFVKDRKHRWVYLNKTFCSFIGYTEEEMIGKSDYDFFPSEQADVFWQMDELVFESENDNINIEQIVDAQGNVRTISTRKTLIVDSTGRKLLVGTIRDISEINRLRENEKNVNKVLKELALGRSHEDILSMILELAEQQFRGMTASILVVDEFGKRLRQAVPSKLPEYFRAVIDGTPIKDGMGACGTAAFRKERVVTMDLADHPYWQRVSELVERANLRSCWSEPVLTSNGNLAGTFALYYDHLKEPDETETQLMETMAQLAAIAIEHHQFEEESTLLRKMLRNIIDSMPSILIGVNLDGNVTQWNLEAEKATGISALRAMGNPLESVYPFLEKDILQDVRTAIGTKTVHPILKNTRQSGGEILYEDITVYPLCTNGIDGAVIRIDDVTERVRYEEAMIQADKMTSIGVLAGGIAHDFNNILVGIVGNLNLAAEYLNQDTPAYTLVRKAEEASLRAKGLANQLLTFSKGGEPLRQVVELKSLLMDSSRFILSGSNVSCSHNMDEKLWPVNIDVDQIGQVIQNLVLNAKQAMTEGGVIEVSCTNADKKETGFPPSLKGDRYVKVEIRDNGPGIPRALLDRIFDPYFTTKRTGSGLGLAVCHSIIRRHDGHIEVKLPQGKGTSFIFYLPATEENQIIEDSIAVPERKAAKGRVLVMDDEQIVQEVLGQTLSFLGCEVVCAFNGEEAVKQYREALIGGEPIDIVIMDLTIPAGMGGREAVSKVLALDPDAKVVVSSGYSNDPIVAQYKKYGFCAALVKPFQLAEVADIVGCLMADKKGSDH